MDYTIGTKHPQRRHGYDPQNVMILEAGQVILYTMEKSYPFVRDPAPTADRHTITVFERRTILNVLTLSMRSVN